MENYYVLERENSIEYPLLKVLDAEIDGALTKPLPLKVSGTVQLASRNIGKKEIYVDFHITPDPVFSGKVAEALTQLNIKHIQLIPAEVENSDNDYFILHVMNQFRCIDREKSDLRMRTRRYIGEINNLVLDQAFLNEIDLEDRLVFRLREYLSTYIVEESVKNAIMATDPVGINFTPVEEWSSTDMFK